MKMRVIPAISQGVLLSRHGDVHRNIGRRTKCGEPVVTGRAATVSPAQVLLYRLTLCRVCYPHQHGGDRP